LSKRTRTHRPNPSSDPLMMRVYSPGVGRAIATEDGQVYVNTGSGIRRAGMVPIERHPSADCPTGPHAHPGAVPIDGQASA
jgi:hypothetical protein